MLYMLMVYCHDESSTIPFSLPLKLDIYKPENIYDNRPVFMWIHGGGFYWRYKTQS